MSGPEHIRLPWDTVASRGGQTGDGSKMQKISFFDSRVPISKEKNLHSHRYCTRGRWRKTWQMVYRTTSRDCLPDRTEQWRVEKNSMQQKRNKRRTSFIEQGSLFLQSHLEVSQTETIKATPTFFSRQKYVSQWQETKLITAWIDHQIPALFSAWKRRTSGWEAPRYVELNVGAATAVSLPWVVLGRYTSPRNGELIA